ncbi:MAG: cysteine dioxygenase family protein [Xanthobacteraceae bacterium]|nr:cysteine dioxygenase family protein [Xanthobacteraceae bacterium]
MLQARPAPLGTRRQRAISTSALSYPVALLMAEIGDACDGPAHAMGDRIAHALRVAAAMPELLTPELRAPRNGCYARHTVAADPAGRFTLLSIVWGAGQFSPPHAHDTWCAYAVAENTLTETLYGFDPRSGKAVAAGTTEREPGYACFAPAGLEQIHRLGNATGVGAISLHAYGVEGSRVGTHVNRLMDVAERER